MLAEAGKLYTISVGFPGFISRVSVGKDATEAFEDVGHSDEARNLLDSLLVGDFEQGGVRPMIIIPTYSYLLRTS